MACTTTVTGGPATGEITDHQTGMSHAVNASRFVVHRWAAVCGRHLKYTPHHMILPICATELCWMQTKVHRLPGCH